MSRSLLLVVLVSLFLAGCTSSVPLEPEQEPHLLASLATGTAQALSDLQVLREEPLVFERPFTVHVVTVGWDVNDLDPESIRDALPTDTSPQILFSEPIDALRGGLDHRIDYRFHEAPEAFVTELFDAYETFSTVVPIPGGDQGFLARYDELYDLQRTGDGTMRLVDVQAVEEHLQQLRQSHGLVFDGPHATVFLLDSHTRYGLWEDSFYWYALHDATAWRADTQNLRAWGGTYDFLFIDRGAAPNDAKTDEAGYTKVFYLFGSQPVTAPEGTGYLDPPAWHYDGERATIGQGVAEHVVTASDAAIRALDPAVNIRILNDYIFRPVLPERIQVNVHLWHDGRSIMPTDQVDELLDAEALKTSLAAAVPWIPVDVVVKTYVAPEDDPGMAAALDRAKREGAGAQAAMPVLLNHVDAHRDQYGANEPGTFDVMALTFLLEGHFATVIPGVAGGAAVTGTDLQCWGTATSMNDATYLREGQDIEQLKHTLTVISAHEVGHCFGLPHAHDGSRRTDTGYEAALDHTWSSTNTTMSYRIDLTGIDHFHRAGIARAHTLDGVEQALRDLEWAHRALVAEGLTSTPAALHAKMATALDEAETAVDLYHQGADIEAVGHAITARDHAAAAMAEAAVTSESTTAEGWDRDGIHAVGAKNSVFVFRPGASATGIEYDYRPIPLGQDADRVTVRATWTNTPDSWGDFFIGWRAPGVLERFFVDLGPAEHSVTMGGGVHDVAEEGPNDGKIVREFSLDLDLYPVLRGEDIVFEAGAGTMGSAVNGAYEVEVVVERRAVG